ncbi:MAG: DUF1287 domain-containing protein [Syntrophomonadaceae bacterium]|nr:DUF1287 domain-containing protein [Syntrophomonadaceae bacterium]
MKRPLLIISLLILVVISLSVVKGWHSGFIPPIYDEISRQASVMPSPVEKIAPEKRTIKDLILLGARQEVYNGTIYDASYEVIAYPQGDVSPERGACTDVIIRAYRNAGIDLQKLIHEDMGVNFNLYPDNWGLSAPDANIDHRRVPNQMTYMQRHALELTTEVVGKFDEWQWGDLVYWRFANGDQHCGIISDRTNWRGVPLVIHNAGQAREEDCLQRWQIIGHFRYQESH